MKNLKPIIILATLMLTQCRGKTPEKSVSQISANKVSVEYVAHACFILEANGKRTVSE